jgi:peptide/nickel transport system permease protein
MGRLLVDAVFARDYPVAMGINLFAAILVLLGSLLADSLYALADPRIRYA